MRVKQVAIFNDDLPADEREQRGVNRQRDQQRRGGGGRQIGRQPAEIGSTRPDGRRGHCDRSGQRELLFGDRGQTDQNSGGDQLPPLFVLGAPQREQQRAEREDHPVQRREGVRPDQIARRFEDAHQYHRDYG